MSVDNDLLESHQLIERVAVVIVDMDEHPLKRTKSLLDNYEAPFDYGERILALAGIGGTVTRILFPALLDPVPWATMEVRLWP